MRSIVLMILSGIAIYTFFSYNTRTSPGNVPDRRLLITPGTTYAITADINDKDDPSRLIGVDLFIGEDISAGKDLKAILSSSNSHVVPEDHLILSGTGTTRNLKIDPVGPGYTTISVKLSNGSVHTTYQIQYAASMTSNMEAKRWHAGIADASAAINIDDDHMIVANDESNYFYLYNRNHTGSALQTFDYNQNNKLELIDSIAGKWKEVDVEAGVKSIADPAITYWIGSMSNNSGFSYKPNRNKIFSVRITGKGSTLSFTTQGHYSNLREKLISWGDAHGYDFKRSAAAGKDPKTVDGFNIEGMVFGPDNRSLYIGFRAPLVPTTLRTNAVIAPIRNFESWFNKGLPSRAPYIGDPIELDLGGRGIRDIIRLSNDNYVIIAGSCGFEIKPAAYSWSGHPSDRPIPITSIDLGALNVEGVIAVCENGRFRNKLQVLTDNGNEIFYCDTLCAKNLSDDRLKKFSSVVLPFSKK